MALINLRNALMAGKRLPYDAEIEFLQSTGTQYIDTGVVPASTSRMVADIKFEGSANMLSGVWASSGRFQFGIASGMFTLGIGSIGQNVIAADTLRHTFILDAGTKTANIDGNQYSLTSASISFAQYTIPIFAQRSTSNTPSNYCHAKLYGYKLFNNGILIRDYIPVRKGNVGYLYDRVSGKLFGNAGTGDFVLGPDVVPVEYIESFRGSGGGQYINTGILATTSTKWEIDIAFTTTTTRQLMGSGYAGSQRFNIGIESSAFRGGFGGGWFTISNTRDTNRHLWRLESLSATQCEASIDGGAAVSYTSTFSPASSPILLSKRRTTDSSTGTRYYASKIWTSGDLVQRLLPVRVGTDATSWEGAMMDVLTRRIYRNAGTGAFAYGNDLKYPIPAE